MKGTAAMGPASAAAAVSSAVCRPLLGLRRASLTHQWRARSSSVSHDAISFASGGRGAGNVAGNHCNAGPAPVWNETENWCSLCREPLNSWADHRGKRDHICLEMFYNAIAQYGRRWSPSTLWCEVEECTLLRRPTFPWLATYDGGGALDECIVDYVRNPATASGGLSLLMEYYDRAEHYKRRVELYACIRHLVDEGIVRTDRGSLGGGASFHGSLVAFKELFPNLVNMFPFADAKEISALTQMISSTYNAETVFDLCNFQALLPPGQGTEMAGTRGGFEGRGVQPAAADGKGRGNDESCVSAAEDYSYHWKGVFCRGVMGQLRWALECDSVASPLVPVDGSKGGGEPYWQVLSEYTCRALLAEMVFCRVSEYIVRVEGVWRKHAFEPTGPQMMSEREQARPPRTSNWGYVQYMGDSLYDNLFGENLPNDGTPKKLPWSK